MKVGKRQSWEFALSLFALFTFVSHKSDLLFMKERFALFKSGKTKTWNKKCKSYWVALLLQKTKDSKSLFFKRQRELIALVELLKRVMRAI